MLRDVSGKQHPGLDAALFQMADYCCTGPAFADRDQKAEPARIRIFSRFRQDVCILRPRELSFKKTEMLPPRLRE